MANTDRAFNGDSYFLNGNVGIGSTDAPYILTTNGGTGQIGVRISNTDRLVVGADGTWNYYAGKSGNSHRFTTTGAGTVLDVKNDGNVHVDADIGGNEPSQRGRLRILNAGGETNSGGLEFHTSSAGGAGYGSRVTSDTSGRMYLQTRANQSSWHTQLTLDSSGGGVETEGYDFTSGAFNHAPPFNSRLWSNVNLNGAIQTYTTASFNGRTVPVMQMQNTASNHWNYFRYDGFAYNNDYLVPGSENYAVFEFWAKNNGGSNTSFSGFIAEGDYWVGSPSRTAGTGAVYTNADGWTLYRAVMLMQDGYRLNFGFGFDYNRQGANMLFAFPSIYFAGGKRGNMQAGVSLSSDADTGNLKINRGAITVESGGQVSGSMAGRQISLTDNNWKTFGWLKGAQSSPLLIRVVGGHNSYGTYSDFINDTYAYNISDGTTVTIGSTSTGSTYSVQLRKIKRTNQTDQYGRRLTNTGDGGWEYQIARNQSFGMNASIHVMGAHGNNWTWVV